MNGGLAGGGGRKAAGPGTQAEQGTPDRLLPNMTGGGARLGNARLPKGDPLLAATAAAAAPPFCLASFLYPRKQSRRRRRPRPLVRPRRRASPKPGTL